MGSTILMTGPILILGVAYTFWLIYLTVYHAKRK